MNLKFNWTSLQAGKDPIQAFTASYTEAEDTAPVVVLVQEVWGVNSHIEDVAIRLAKAGYFVVAPDLLSLGGSRAPEVSFERIEEFKDIIDTVGFPVWGDPEKRQQVLDEMDKEKADRLLKTQEVAFSQIANRDKYVEVLKSVIGNFKSKNSDRKVGAVGFCMGGALVSALVCSDSKLDVGVSFYGSVPAQDIMQNISCPLLGIYAGEDTNVNSGIETFKQEVQKVNGDLKVVIYPGAQHGFHNDTRPSFSIDASRDAWARCLTIFSQYMGEDYSNL